MAIDNKTEMTHQEEIITEAPLAPEWVEEPTIKAPLAPEGEVVETGDDEAARLERIPPRVGPWASIPLRPATIKPVLNLKNEVLAHVTKTELQFWGYTPEEWNALEEILIACQINAPAAVQLIIFILGRDTAKMAELRLLRKWGKLPKEGG